MGAAFTANDSNLARSKSNFTPHQEMYRQVVSRTLDADAIDAIACGPDYQIMLAVPPQWLPAQVFTVVAAAAYLAEKSVTSRPHLKWARQIGLAPMMIDAKAAARDGALVDLICAAATIPPVFDIPKWEGRPVLDGGMADKAPPPDPDEGTTLFLLTSRYRNLPHSSRRTYVQPSCEVPADKIDFSDRTKLDGTSRQGALDGTAWLEQAG